MCFTSAGTSWPLIVCVRVTSSNGTPKTRVVLAELLPSLPGNGDTLFLMASSSSSSPQPRQDLTSSGREKKEKREDETLFTFSQSFSQCEPENVQTNTKTDNKKSEATKRSSTFLPLLFTNKMSAPPLNIQEWQVYTLLHVFELPQGRRREEWAATLCHCPAKVFTTGPGAGRGGEQGYVLKCSLCIGVSLLSYDLCMHDQCSYVSHIYWTGGWGSFLTKFKFYV